MAADLIPIYDGLRPEQEQQSGQGERSVALVDSEKIEEGKVLAAKLSDAFKSNGKWFVKVSVTDAVEQIAGSFSKAFMNTVSGYMLQSDYNGLSVVEKSIPANFAGLEAVQTPTRLRYQYFVIEEVVEDEDYVTVTARHVWYENLKNYTTWEADKETTYSVSQICASVMSNTLAPVATRVATDCEDTKIGKDIDYKNKNLVEAFLDPEKGICAQFKLSLIRDNWSFYVLKNVGYDRGFVVENGKNLLGVERKESIENLATRVAPIAKDAKGNIIWMNNNGLKYLDSPYVSSYARPYVEIFDTGLQIGKDDVTDANIQAKLLEAAQKRFSDDHVDIPEIEMTIDFLSLGDTIEYSQYRGLDKVYLYDIITVKDTVRGYQYTAQVVGVEHDILTGMLNSVTIGKIQNGDGVRKIATWQVPQVSGENIRLKSIMAGAFDVGAIQGDDIAVGGVQWVHLDAASIEDLTTAQLEALQANIHTLIAGSITAEDITAGTITATQIDAASVRAAIINAGKIGASDILAESVRAAIISAGKISADDINATSVRTAILNAGKIAAEDIEAGAITAAKINTNDLQAIQATLQIANIANAQINSADINVAHIKELDAQSAFLGQAVFQEAVGGKLYVPRLSVGYAQMLSATIGDLVIQASNDLFYKLDVDMNGNVTATQMTPTAQEIANGYTQDGRTIYMGTDILATDLNTQNIYASHGLMDEITANIINVDKLLARQAVITWLNAQDITSNTYLRATIGNWNSQQTMTEAISGLNDAISGLGYGTVYMQPDEPSHSHLTAGDIWIQTLSDGTWQQIYDDTQNYPTWQSIYDNVSTWQTVGSMPIMWVWDGRQFQLMYDSLLPYTVETEILQLQYLISLRATKTEVDELSHDVSVFNAQLTIQAEQIRSAVNAVNTKASSYIMFADPRTVYGSSVSLGDIWIKRDEHFQTWQDAYDYYQTWQEIYDTHDEWEDGLGDETYVWNGTEWIQTADRAAEIRMSTEISQTAKSIELQAKQSAKFQDDLYELSARISITASQIQSEVTRATNSEASMSSRITQTAESIESVVQQIGDFSYTEYSTVKQTQDNILLGVTSVKALETSTSNISIKDNAITISSSGQIICSASQIMIGSGVSLQDSLDAKGNVESSQQEFRRCYDTAGNNPSTNWDTTAPAWVNGETMWMRTRITHPAPQADTFVPSEKGTCISGAVGSTGGTGRGISSVVEKYLISSSSSGVTRDTQGWTTTIQTPTASKPYLWNYETITYTSGTTTEYTDPVIIGNYSNDGVSITGVIEHYLATSLSSGVTKATTGWTTTIQTITSTNKYLWNYEEIAYSNGSYAETDPVIIGVYGDQGEQGIQGIQGVPGRGISTVETRYYLHTSYTNAPTAAWDQWSTTMPAYEANKYYWFWTKTTFTDGTVSDLKLSELGVNAAYDQAADAYSLANGIVSGSQNAFYASNIQNTGITIDDTTLHVTSTGNMYIDSGGALVIRNSQSTEQNPQNCVVMNNSGIAVKSTGKIVIDSGGTLELRSSASTEQAISNNLLISQAGISMSTGATFTVTSHNFNIDNQGNVSMTGTVTATAGSIASFEISGTHLQDTNGYVGFDSNYQDDWTTAIWAGLNGLASPDFRVTYGGYVIMKKLMYLDDEGNLQEFDFYNHYRDFYNAVSVAISGSWSGDTYTAQATNTAGTKTYGTVTTTVSIGLNSVIPDGKKAATVYLNFSKGGNTSIKGIPISTEYYYNAGWNDAVDSMVTLGTVYQITEHGSGDWVKVTAIGTGYSKPAKN